MGTRTMSSTVQHSYCIQFFHTFMCKLLDLINFCLFEWGSSSEQPSLFLVELWLNTQFVFIQEVISCRISCVQKHVSRRKLFWHGTILYCAVMFNARHHCAVPGAEPGAPAAFHRGVFGYLAAAPGQSQGENTHLSNKLLPFSICNRPPSMTKVICLEIWGVRSAQGLHLDYCVSDSGV